MLKVIHLDPNDGTRYTVIVGITPNTERDFSRLVFGFGVGERSGGWLSYPVADIPQFTFDYFQALIGHHVAGTGYDTQVGFSIFLHIVGQRRWAGDEWPREAKLGSGWLNSIPTLSDLLKELP